LFWLLWIGNNLRLYTLGFSWIYYRSIYLIWIILLYSRYLFGLLRWNRLKLTRRNIVIYWLHLCRWISYFLNNWRYLNWCFFSRHYWIIKSFYCRYLLRSIFLRANNNRLNNILGSLDIWKQILYLLWNQFINFLRLKIIYFKWIKLCLI
jgi:hypothetical protein